MENIYLDQPLSVDEIRSALGNIFRELTVFHFDYGEEPEGMDFQNPDHIFFDLTGDEERKEFGWCITINRTPEVDSQERQLLIGLYFSSVYGIRVLVPYTHPEDPGSPYYDIVFENGVSYLADDSDTSFADGTEGLVQILGPHHLPELEFDEKGNLTGYQS